MPIFEYKCADCGKISEFLEKAGGRKTHKCEHCGCSNLEKQFSVFAAGIKEGESKRCGGCSDFTCPHAGR